MKHPKPKFICVSVRMPAELYKKIAALAEADRRKISEWVRLVVEQAVEAREQHQSDR